MFSNRRRFLQAGFLSSAVFVMSGCQIFTITSSLETIKVLQNDLFAQAQQLHIDTASYISIILHHSRVTKEDKAFIKNGVKWLNEASVEVHKKLYTQLTALERQNILRSIAKTKWGSAYIETMMGYIFEAMLGDPIYGSNNNEAGWRWLNFEGGLPRVKKAYL